MWVVNWPVRKFGALSAVFLRQRYLDGIRLDAGQMSAYIGSAFNTARKRRVKMIVIVRTSPHRAAPDTLS
jgi:hypothetical protein